MLEAQKVRIYERSRLRAKGVSEDEIAKIQKLPFKPAFVDRRRVRCEAPTAGVLPPPQFAFRREG